MTNSRLRLNGLFGRVEFDVKYLGANCSIYSEDDGNSFERIIQDLAQRNLTPLNPRETAELILNALSVGDDLVKETISRRPVLIANDRDVYLYEEGVVSVAGDVKTPRKRVDLRGVSEYQPIESLNGNPYFLAKFGREGVQALKQLASKEIPNLSKFPSYVYLPFIQKNLINEDPIFAHCALDLTGERIYFNGWFQDFAHCAVFGKKQK